MNDRASTPRRLSGMDAVFVYAETPTMCMHTLGTLILDPAEAPGGRFGYDEIVETLASRIHLMPPFRQRLLEIPLGLGHPVLADDPEFRVERHLHRLAVPSPGSLRELAEVVGDIAGRPLDRSQPLWEMWAIEGLEGERIALVTKMHHCMLDGASGSSQMAQLLDLEPGAPATKEPAPSWDPPPLPSAFELARHSLGSRFVGPLSLGRLAYRTAKGAWSRRRAQGEVAGEPPLPEPAPSAYFGGAITPHRVVAYGSASLPEIKRVKNAFGVTVNDAVLAACALALRRYLEAHGEAPERPLYCLVPVSVKSQQEKSEFSNKVSTMAVRLPTHLADPERVVGAVREEMATAKHVFAAVEDDLIPQWLELVSPIVATVGARLYSDLHLADWQPSNTNLVVSNMQGPPLPLYFGGARVEAVYPMGPVGEGLGLNLTVLSNMDRLDLGILACRERVPDVWQLAEGFADAVRELAGAADALSAGRSVAGAASSESRPTLEARS